MCKTRDTSSIHSPQILYIHTSNLILLTETITTSQPQTHTTHILHIFLDTSIGGRWLFRYDGWCSGNCYNPPRFRGICFSDRLSAICSPDLRKVARIVRIFWIGELEVQIRSMWVAYCLPGSRSRTRLELCAMKLF